MPGRRCGRATLSCVAAFIAGVLLCSACGSVAARSARGAARPQAHSPPQPPHHAQRAQAPAQAAETTCPQRKQHVEWQLGAEYSFTVTTKWWLGIGHSGIDEASVRPHLFRPPVSRNNQGLRCKLSIVPLRQETWPPLDTAQAPASGNSDGHGDQPNALLCRAQLLDCQPLHSRFNGPYVPHSEVIQGYSDIAGDMAHLYTPFFFTWAVTGVVRRLYVFANETLSSRNFKRGSIAFLTLQDPRTSVGAVPRVDEIDEGQFDMVDQDEHGVCVALRRRWWIHVFLGCVLFYGIQRVACFCVCCCACLLLALLALLTQGLPCMHMQVFRAARCSPR